MDAPDCPLVDTFPRFLEIWATVEGQPLEAKIDAWAGEYLAPWPELLAMQVENYAKEGEDWRQVARERVFPFLSGRLPAMTVAHDHLRRSWAEVCDRAQARLGFVQPLTAVIYVGVGCGAGWAATFGGRPAVLFGLEMIAECGWQEPPALTGLMAHEIGHLAHFHWRAEAGLDHGTGPWWQLFTEGFAQRCEHRILGEETWHMRAGSELPTAERGGLRAGAPGGWLAWCRANRAWLAAEFLRAADEGGSVRPFFGSWYDIQGQSQTGYYLGHELIRALELTMTLREIALLDQGDPLLRQELERLAGASSARAG
jgi:hypothetical protein